MFDTNEIREKKENECRVIGFKAYDEKDEEKKLTGKKMLRIELEVINPGIENYIGGKAIQVYLDYNEELERDLKKAVENGNICHYLTSDNIISGKTKVTSIII